MKDHLLIQWHLGLGDAVICNAIVRHYATQHELVCVPVKYHNCVSVEYMLRDAPNVVIRPVEDDEDMQFFANEVWKGHKLGLGMYGRTAFDPQRFDREFFRQAGLDFDLRWAGWNCERDAAIEDKVMMEFFGSKATFGYGFYHDDKERGFAIKPEYTAGMFNILPWMQYPLMAWQGIVERAEAIHCINSSFALFVDSLKELPTNPKLYLHLYSRPGGEVPTFKKNWIKLL